MLLDNLEGCIDATAGQSVILGQLQPRLQPELCFAAGVLDMHVCPSLFAGEEVEAIAANSQNGRTHDPCISGLPITSLMDLSEFYTGSATWGRVLWPSGEMAYSGRVTLDFPLPDVGEDIRKRFRMKGGRTSRRGLRDSETS